jgi:hypothetical protein
MGDRDRCVREYTPLWILNSAGESLAKFCSARIETEPTASTLRHTFETSSFNYSSKSRVQIRSFRKNSREV